MKYYPAIYKIKKLQNTYSAALNSVREKIRTPGLLIRSQTLYPAELRAHLVAN